MNLCQTILLVSLLCTCGDSTPNSNKRTDLLPRSIIELKKYYEVVENLEQRGILTEEQARQERQLYIEFGSKLIEKDRLLTVKEFLGYEKRASIISFSNIIAVFAGFVIFVTGLCFISVYISPNLTDIPVETWEKLLYFLDFLLIFLCNNSWLVFLGCLAFFATLTLSYRLGRLGEETEILEVMSFILFFGWSIVAIYHQNREVGYLAITALGVFSNCLIIKGKLPESLGFTRSSLLPSITISSFIFVMIGSFLHLTPVNLLTNPFVRPLLFIGTLGYFIGIFILSFGLYDTINQNQDLYSLLQIITFLSGLASIFFPPMFDIPFLQGIGRTMLVVWLSIKYIQYADWRTRGSSITSLFGLGILLYGFAYFYKAIPSTLH